MREPSGEIRGEKTRARRRASAVPNNFFPSLLRGAGASCFSFASWLLATADVANSNTQTHTAGFRRFAARTSFRRRDQPGPPNPARVYNTGVMLQRRRLA